MLRKWWIWFARTITFHSQYVHIESFFIKLGVLYLGNNELSLFFKNTVHPIWFTHAKLRKNDILRVQVKTVLCYSNMTSLISISIFYLISYSSSYCVLAQLRELKTWSLLIIFTFEKMTTVHENVLKICSYFVFLDIWTIFG